MNEYEWDAFFQYFWGTDRIQHELWHIFDEDHPRHNKEEAAKYREQVYAYFRRVDEIVGELIARAGQDAFVWVVSDHGFGPAHKYCSFNLWLLQERFLRLKSDALTRLKHLMFKLGITPEMAFKIVRSLPLGGLRPARGVSTQAGASKLLSTVFLSFNDVDWSRTVAFSKGNYGQIFINLEGREPNGSVSQSEYDGVCNKIVERLKALRDPLNGQQWVGDVFRRDQIYKGPLVDEAPDIAFLPRDMRYLPLGNADFTSNKFMVDAFGISGCHRMHGVMIANGGPVLAGQKMPEAHIYDVAPTMLYLLGQDIPDDMDGRILFEIASREYVNNNPAHFAASGESDRAEEVEFSSDDDADIRERLRSLGYMG
jgi:predicted AlkP superfamily phosphohydrolase/phosphomutase